MTDHGTYPAPRSVAARRDHTVALSLTLLAAAALLISQVDAVVDIAWVFWAGGLVLLLVALVLAVRARRGRKQL